ncbi:hypothetical protein BAX97_11295 [Elizabethkingia meningoseptica]|uniref:DUF2490 domain-containing protein n=1 Tax=Elizabethkingia meningoseptica TaxID=238 RepID=UPI000332D225|nr:DUF2490 domain-containing protein [Elizabethkingia meningoseptica]AQX05778.1 hypothetical protein BBD33_11215 [Elizabethkingia meningoseptica]AQX47821.1 hypothetical protein B5G46_11205 [Elizabethkingia meningoseptica]EOR28494.1 hypothetical protein L100_15990 [Elizabethkingia meningoseptica ATCC 13253 = NBRC 12535]KUY23010.1 hypothetical protein ATB99_14530 [Elizabethkingia meningoseptica]MDE5487271.1 DUF2490 domain-containing protein [Elizabethkingia meningoseptica]
MIKRTLALFAGISFGLLAAQKSDVGNWFMLFGSEKVNSKFNIHYEVQYRNYDFIGDLNQLLLRTGIGYNLSENNNNVLLGYAYVHSHNYDADQNIKQLDEHRIFQQFITKQKFGRVMLNHRYRIEERFLQPKTEVRFRYQLGVIVPFNNSSLTADTWYASIYDEIFINAKKEAFDRNRLYGAIGYVVNDKIRLEAGVMNQALSNTHRYQFQIGFYLNDVFNLKK